MKFKLTDKIKTDIQRAVSDTSSENCGVVTNKGEVIAIDNVAIDPSEMFVFDKKLWEQHREKAVAIWHTHCKDTQAGELSPADIVAAKTQQMPYILYHSIFGDWDLFNPANPYPFPLTQPEDFDPANPAHWSGMRFVYGRSDCLTLFQGWYKANLDIDVQDPRNGLAVSEDRFKRGWNLFLENYEAQGFVGINPAEAWAPSPGTPANLQKHDILLQTVAGQRGHGNPVHCAIVLDPEKMQILHHMGRRGELSKVDQLVKEYRDRTQLIIRHYSQIKEVQPPPELAEVDPDLTADVWGEEAAA